jgi:adenosylcobinamide kinase/adenosylcobinamide-phosphate guanylyltransferase
MGKLTFILGGARSGKSSFAQKLAEQSGKSVTFIATAQAFDDEMSARIQKHRTERHAGWTTLEIPSGIAAHLREHPTQTDLVLLDCITLLVTNLIMQHTKDDVADEQQSTQSVENEVSGLLAYMHESEQEWILISNEVGLGLVPPYQMGRVFRDLLGMANQKIASAADVAYWMVAGIPVPIDGYQKTAN